MKSDKTIVRSQLLVCIPVYKVRGCVIKLIVWYVVMIGVFEVAWYSAMISVCILLRLRDGLIPCNEKYWDETWMCRNESYEKSIMAT